MKTISVSCAIIIHLNKVLVAKRSSSMSQPGMWEFPGGKLEEGESLEESLIREIKEELGIEISVGSQLTVSKFTYSEEKIVELTPFICAWESGDIRVLEHERVVWMEIGDLSVLNWAPADIPVFNELLENWQAFRSRNTNKAKN
ncbi:(deoxy)nucleoside triphosphate pyrophosphohydrolase [Algoriphagus lutimaris]|uniref:(deoxy)nucleoside triphosphate pyrophosphohydrolase n=1 Tax=Algoriphagus lutimaris TaxID=613197 RepID=UPI00196B2B86|nr:(deoxy)nucleoside triphosphate pyrophosphohydrolase [Algoriphagus lutimaris]MBN3521925.1 (deoxy)nucleoside triphosphate pyrophosphohydrolase [Algoriphagus lutimaris]